MDKARTRKKKERAKGRERQAQRGSGVKNYANDETKNLTERLTLSMIEKATESIDGD